MTLRNPLVFFIDPAPEREQEEDCMAKQPSSMAPDAAKKACESKMKKDQMGNMSKMGNDSNSHP